MGVIQPCRHTSKNFNILIVGYLSFMILLPQFDFKSTHLQNGSRVCLIYVWYTALSVLLFLREMMCGYGCWMPGNETVSRSGPTRQPY